MFTILAQAKSFRQSAPGTEARLLTSSLYGWTQACGLVSRWLKAGMIEPRCRVDYRGKGHATIIVWRK